MNLNADFRLCLLEVLGFIRKVLGRDRKALGRDRKALGCIRIGSLGWVQNPDSIRGNDVRSREKMFFWCLRLPSGVGVYEEPIGLESHKNCWYVELPMVKCWTKKSWLLRSFLIPLIIDNFKNFLEPKVQKYNETLYSSTFQVHKCLVLK